MGAERQLAALGLTGELLRDATSVTYGGKASCYLQMRQMWRMQFPCAELFAYTVRRPSTASVVNQLCREPVQDCTGRAPCLSVYMTEKV